MQFKIGLLLAMTLTLTINAGLPEILATIAEIETGALNPEQSISDYKVGASNEISRYQILPKIWKQYTVSPRFYDPDVSYCVAKSILNRSVTKFVALKKRNPTPNELYILWHRPAEAYNGRPTSRTVERADRFANLYFARLAGEQSVRDNSARTIGDKSPKVLPGNVQSSNGGKKNFRSREMGNLSTNH